MSAIEPVAWAVRRQTPSYTAIYVPSLRGFDAGSRECADREVEITGGTVVPLFPHPPAAPSGDGEAGALRVLTTNPTEER